MYMIINIIEDLVMKYSIGVDFGTLSGRIVLVEEGTGKLMATADASAH